MSDPGPLDRITFTPTLADTLAAYRLHAMRPRRIAVYALLYGGVLAGIGLAFHDTPRGIAMSFAIGFAAMWLLWGLWIAVLLPFRVRRVYRQQANLRREYDVAWSEAGLAVRSPNIDATTPWADYIARKESATSILVYHSDQLFQFIPARALGPGRLATLRPYLDRLPIKS